MRVLAGLAAAGIAAAAGKLLLASGHGHHARVLLSGRDLVIAAGITFAAVIACVLSQNTTR